MAYQNSTQIQQCIDRLAEGGLEVRNELIGRSCDQLRRLTQRILAGDRIHQFEDTDDVLDGAVIRLREALRECCPETVADYYRLASVQIRRELIRLARHYYCSVGWGTLQRLNGFATQNHNDFMGGVIANDTSPSRQAARNEEWEQLHLQIAALPDDLRQVGDLVWLHGLTNQQASQALGVSERTIRRRWLRARLQLQHSLCERDDERPAKVANGSRF